MGGKIMERKREREEMRESRVKREW